MPLLEALAGQGALFLLVFPLLVLLLLFLHLDVRDRSEEEERSAVVALQPSRACPHRELWDTHRRGFQPAAGQCGAAAGTGLASLHALPRWGAAVRAPRGATRR